MLQNIRDNVQGTMAKVIVAIIIVPFAIFGVETLFSSNGPTPVAKVNGSKISELDLAQAISMQKRQMLAMMGDKIQPELLDEAKLREPALDGLITQQLLRDGADNLKLRISPQVVDQTILAVPQFQEAGRFSPERYQMLLREQGFTPAYYKQLLQRELLIDQLHSGISDSEFATAAELDVVTGLLQQQRSFAYAVLPVANIESKVSISDADVNAYYQAHSDQYLREERVKLDYIELQSADFAKPIDAAAVRAEYEHFVQAFNGGTERHAAHILIEINGKRSDAEALARAKEAAQKITAGESFDTAVQAYSDDLGSKGTGGDLGASRGEAFPPAFEAALARLKVGEVSAPVKSDAGYHIIKLLDQQTDTVPSFEAKKADIERQLSMSGAHPELAKTVEKLRDMVFNSDGLGAPAKDAGLTVKSSDWVARSATDKLFGDAKVQAAVFSKEVLKEGNNSDVIELNSDHFIVLRVSAHEAATPKPLADVSAQITAALKHEHAVAEARKQAQQIVVAVEHGDDLQKLALAAGYKVESVTNTLRSTSTANPEITRAAFSMSRPDKAPALDSVALSSGDVVVVQLQGVTAGAKDSLDATQRASLARQLEQADGMAAFAAYMDSLRKAAKIVRQ